MYTDFPRLATGSHPMYHSCVIRYERCQVPDLRRRCLGRHVECWVRHHSIESYTHLPHITHQLITGREKSVMATISNLAGWQHSCNSCVTRLVPIRAATSKYPLCNECSENAVSQPIVTGDHEKAADASWDTCDLAMLLISNSHPLNGSTAVSTKRCFLLPLPKS